MTKEEIENELKAVQTAYENALDDQVEAVMAAERLRFRRDKLEDKLADAFTAQLAAELTGKGTS
jgi:hypothetical protein